ncbi:MAG: acyl-CoA/acyl-ACP dehydrogenase [Candidatus Rokubacteria bacterium]|nr:acyl-CoA/acyl-ACP dehydrogenase [Candidatus Rokubacteria bacterium]
MDFRPTDQQRMLAAVARDFLDKRWPLAVAQDVARDGRGLPNDVWRELAALGWAGLRVPGDLGGSEASLLDVVLLAEEMGRAAFPARYVTSAVVATAIIAAGTSAQRQRVLPAMSAGDRFATLALAEPDGSGPDGIALTAEVGRTLDGVKRFVLDADAADHVIVAARGGGGVTLVLVDARHPGVGVSSTTTMAGDRLFEVTFAGVPVRADDVIGPAGGGRAILDEALAHGAVARAAEIVGTAQRILDLTVEHAKVRVQSGRPIGAFQAIQHACADLLRDVETARGLVYHAAWRVDAGRDAATAIAMASAYAGTRGLAVARRAHQIFGAMGYSAEHPLHLLHKRIHAASVESDRAAHLDTIARAIGLA